MRPEIFIQKCKEIRQEVRQEMSLKYRAELADLRKKIMNDVLYNSCGNIQLLREDYIFAQGEKQKISEAKLHNRLKELAYKYATSPEYY